MNQYIDHTNLKPFATRSSIIKLCNEAKQHKFRGICVNSRWIPLVCNELKDINIKIISTIGFPLGAVSSKVKIFEAKLAVKEGATELDVIWDLGSFKNGDYVTVLMELIELVKLAPIKVIVETCYLNSTELKDAYIIVEDSGAQFIKTSTGFFGGAKLSTIKMWKELGDLKIKAAGEIRTYSRAKKFIDAGANVIGTSSGIPIIIGELNASDELHQKW